MTKKRIGLSLTSHTQGTPIPLRQARENQPDPHDKDGDLAYHLATNEDGAALHTPTGHSERDGLPPEIVHMETHEDGTSERGITDNLHLSETLSPASAFTPSESSVALSIQSVASPLSRKRAWAESSVDTEERKTKGGRGNKTELIDLLNPAPGDSTENGAGLRFSGLGVSRSVYDTVEKVSDDTHAPRNDSFVTNIPGLARYPELKPRPAVWYDQYHRSNTADASNDGEEQRKKGRKGPLESDQRRKEVLEVRDMGACLRCHIMRIRCTAVKDGDCASCRETLPNSRRWTVPCTRTWMRDRWDYLLPGILRQRHDPKRTLPTFDLAKLGKPLVVPLTHESKLDIEIDVREVLDSSLPPAIWGAQLTNIVEGDTFAKVQMVTNQGPPIVPVLAFSPAMFDKAVWKTSRALEEQVSKISQRWIIDIFPRGKSEPWPRNVLHMVVSFQREVARSSVLDEGLKTCLFRFLMNHAFYIPFDRMTEVNLMLTVENQLTWEAIQTKQDHSHIWCPTVVNKFLKSTILKLMQQHLQKLFKELEGLFKLHDTTGDQAKLSELDRDEAFCAIVVSFIIIGTFQIKLLQGARAWDKEEGGTDSTQEYDKPQEREAIACIKLMETEVVDHILQLWKYRYYRQNMPGVTGPEREEMARRAKGFGQAGGVMGAFAKLQQDQAENLYGLKPELDLDDTVIDRFETQNVSRLFLRLSEAIWKPRAQRKQSSVV